MHKSLNTIRRANIVPSRSNKFKQGQYVPRFPEKYIGDPSKIWFMSSWELHMHKALDNNPNVIMWGSEEFAIPYLKPTDGKVHKYYPDYYVKYVNAQGDVVEEIIEIKPKAQRRLKRNAGLYEQVTYAINVAKWQAAENFCKQRRIHFRLLSEDQLYPGRKK